MLASRGITLFFRNAKQYNHLSYISFKRIILYNYALLPVSVKLLETFLGAIL